MYKEVNTQNISLSTYLTPVSQMHVSYITEGEPQLHTVEKRLHTSTSWHQTEASNLFHASLVLRIYFKVKKQRIIA